MSAFAAFNQSSKNSSESSLFNAALSNTITKSSIKANPKNSIFADDSIILGLNKDDYIIVNGTYELTILKGDVLVNNLFKLGQGKSYPIITNAYQSLPVICGMEGSSKKQESILPAYTSVVKISNLDTGLQHVGHVSPKLSDSYFLGRSSPYTFEVVEEPQENVMGFRVNSSTHRAITEVSEKLLSGEIKSSLVVGAAFCGKSTFAHTFLNYLLFNGSTDVVVIDLDPNSGKFSFPGCLALTVHSHPSIGVHTPTDRLENESVYYGHSNPTALPTYYVKCVEQLKEAYMATWKHLPLIINAPPTIKGLGRELLARITEMFHDLDPTLVYLSQNDSLTIEDFDVDEFEVQDNPDDEVLADLTYTSSYKVHATRRKPKCSGPLAHELATIQYFHRISQFRWDVQSFLVQTPPSVIPFSPNDPRAVPAIASLHQTITSLRRENIQDYIEASLVALCAIDIPRKSLSKTSPQFINTDDFTQHKSTVVCHCIIHSLKLKEGYYLVYLPKDPTTTNRLKQAFSSNQTLAFVKGEGSIPPGEISVPQFTGRNIPYVVPEPLSKVGGVWNIRKNLGRKNQKS
ncbi:hypothetical protein FT663_04555 [Candidozyma haemuli var. vulneris]|uniref:Polynucleotide 5'-hydroxyl-kinase GRC3 n=1 Tax=Candidozyma haemuli TaxID=45357 RepID=A0A2V1B0Q4_9ASCO|nr:hypothetical protein CXQ85_003779 [[Candida] haemuloni]KAF3986425.1 hypothetical protein FT662_04576 [[Candida] haemuloni var. vulneris]KAF3987203.1 hypothetical protein FT663_04555 [[Candida] haemuloni var. vulneris]PVH23489.1 hypothetical protein CXQ85_003779 [[Candida] haemuloni]